MFYNTHNLRPPLLAIILVCPTSSSYSVYTSVLSCTVQLLTSPACLPRHKSYAAVRRAHLASSSHCASSSRHHSRGPVLVINTAPVYWILAPAPSIPVSRTWPLRFVHTQNHRSASVALDPHSAFLSSHSATAGSLSLCCFDFVGDDFRPVTVLSALLQLVVKRRQESQVLDSNSVARHKVRRMPSCRTTNTLSLIIGAIAGALNHLLAPRRS